MLVNMLDFQALIHNSSKVLGQTQSGYDVSWFDQLISRPCKHLKACRNRTSTRVPRQYTHTGRNHETNFMQYAVVYYFIHHSLHVGSSLSLCFFFPSNSLSFHKSILTHQAVVILGKYHGIRECLSCSVRLPASVMKSTTSGCVMSGCLYNHSLTVSSRFHLGLQSRL